MSSKLPGSDSRGTTGLNGLMTSYPDIEFGSGLDEKGVPAEAGPMARLPDGFVHSSEDEELAAEMRRVAHLKVAGPEADPTEGLGDLSGFIHEASVVDLSWLEVTEQDADRLPRNPVDTVIPELEEAWGSLRPVPGIHFQLQANVDPEVARYRANLSKEPEAPKFTKKQVFSALRKAMRRSAAGHPLNEVLSELRASLGGDTPQANKAASLIKEDHRLAGRVFVRAEAYPGCANGDWTDHVKRTASSAKYVVAKDKCAGCVFAQQGHCATFKKELVSEVPWEEALEVYGPVLTASGRSLGEGDPRKVLKAAFKQKATPFAQIQSDRPTHVAPVDRVSSEEAHRAIASKTERQVIDPKVAHAEKEVKKAQLRIAKWVREGLLARDVGARIVASGATAAEMLREAADLVLAAPEVREFSGIYNQLPTADIDPKTAAEQLAQAKAARSEANARVEQIAAERRHGSTRDAKRMGSVRAKVAKVAKAIDNGVRGQILARFITRTIPKSDVALAAPLLDPLLKKTGALNEPEQKVAGFSGPVFSEAPMTRHAALAPSPKEIASMLRWASLKLNEGVVGEEFDTLLQFRYAASIRKAGSAALQELREKHEGLAGHVYVDATSYASKTGTAGCEKGALQHRTNALKYVLAMDRCSTCAFANKLADGTSKCQKYAKQLVSETPIANPDEYRREIIHLANSSDAERTASMFAPAYNPTDFDLVGGPQVMEDFDYTYTPEEQLSGVFFGGGIDLSIADEAIGFGGDDGEG